MAKKVAVCLSGCGFLDGSEIHEATFALLALDQAGAKIICCAPAGVKLDVVDHVAKKPAGGTRDVLAESARIARGDIRPLSDIKAKDIDALIFPGGFGAAKNLCTFATEGADCKVNSEVETLVSDMLEMKKPIGAICIAPALLARIVGRKHIPAKLTIGTDAKTAAVINQMGASHCDCVVTEMVADEKHKIVSTPAYMLGRGPAEVFAGIKKCVDKVLALA
jgi:enhancing lycopene biosynthesis protein 2